MSHVIEIDICSNCKQHAWCTRHNEATYSTLAEELKRTILNQIPDVTVKIHLVGGHKMGSFEVYYKDINLFSKLSLGYFPHVGLLTTHLANGKDLQKYKYSMSPIKHNPTYSLSPSKSSQNTNLNSKGSNIQLSVSHEKKQALEKSKERIPEPKKQAILQIHKEPKNQIQKKVPAINKKENKITIEENPKHNEQIIQNKKKTQQKQEKIIKIEEPKATKLKTNQNKQEQKPIQNVEGKKTSKNIKAEPKIETNQIQHPQEQSEKKQTKKSQPLQIITDPVPTKKKTQINHQHSKKQQAHAQTKQLHHPSLQGQKIKQKIIENDPILKQKPTHQQERHKEDNNTKNVELQNSKQKTVTKHQVTKPVQNSHKQPQSKPHTSPKQEVHLPVEQKIQAIHTPQQVNKDHSASLRQQVAEEKIVTHSQEANKVVQTKIETPETPQAPESHVQAQITIVAE